MTKRAKVFGALIVALLGCAVPRGAPEPDNGPRFSGVQLVLKNHHWLDVAVLVEHDGQTTRIGDVDAASSKTFELAAWMLGETGVIRLIANPIGETQITATDLITVQGGQTIEWTLESQLRRSSVAVY